MAVESPLKPYRNAGVSRETEVRFRQTFNTVQFRLHQLSKYLASPNAQTERRGASIIVAEPDTRVSREESEDECADHATFGSSHAAAIPPRLPRVASTYRLRIHSDDDAHHSLICETFGGRSSAPTPHTAAQRRQRAEPLDSWHVHPASTFHHVTTLGSKAGPSRLPCSTIPED